MFDFIKLIFSSDVELCSLCSNEECTCTASTVANANPLIGELQEIEVLYTLITKDRKDIEGQKTFQTKKELLLWLNSHGSIVERRSDSFDVYEGEERRLMVTLR